LFRKRYKRLSAFVLAVNLAFMPLASARMAAATGAVVPGVITTIAGKGMAGYSGDGGPAVSAGLDNPMGVAVDDSGNLLIADYHNNCIRRVDKGGIITTVAGNGKPGYIGDGGLATSAELSSPDSVAVDTSGVLYIADTGNNCVRKVDTAGIISTVAKCGAVSLAVDKAGNVYAADTWNNRICKIDNSGTVTAVAGNGTASYSGDGVPAAGAGLSSPRGVAVDGSGSLYIADTDNSRIRKVDVKGIISTVAGNGCADFNYRDTGDGGPATNAGLHLPEGVAVDGAGNIYILEGDSEIVRKVDTSGAITTVAGNGQEGYTGDGGPATAAELFFPTNAAVDASGDIYISDSGNNRIRVVAAATPAIAVFTVGRKSYTIGGRLVAADAAPFILNGRLMAPVYFLTDALGAQAMPHNPAQQVTITRGSDVIILRIESDTLLVNGRQIQMDTAPAVVDSRIYLPARYVAEALGYAVHWNPADQSVSITR
jgi:sugar lactone lactonase YvrE